MTGPVDIAASTTAGAAAAQKRDPKLWDTALDFESQLV